MSSALVRQALEFVDTENSGSGRNQKRTSARRAAGQVSDSSLRYRRTVKKKSVPRVVSAADKEEKNINTLLLLSQHTQNTDNTKKLLERAVRGKALLEPPPAPAQGSVLFPTEQAFKDFEREYFCS